MAIADGAILAGDVKLNEFKKNPLFKGSAAHQPKSAAPRADRAAISDHETAQDNLPIPLCFIQPLMSPARDTASSRDEHGTHGLDSQSSAEGAGLVANPISRHSESIGASMRPAHTLQLSSSTERIVDGAGFLVNPISKRSGGTCSGP